MKGRWRNVLVISSDEHDPRHAGFSGSPVVRTPHLDRLAARGAVFTRAYTQSPICVPARASLATGRWVHQHRCWDNAIAYAGQPRAWGHRLREAGVPVESIGKLHYRDAQADTGFDRQQEAVHLEGVGQVWACVRDPLPEKGGGAGLFRNIGAGESDYNRFDRRVADGAIAWIRERSKRSDDRPAALFVGLVAPHFPLIVPQAYLDLYPLESLPWPKLRPDTGYVRHPWVERQAQFNQLDAELGSDERRRLAMACYFALITFMDEQVGRILAALEQSGAAEDTLVIYLSDHGDNLGSRGTWNKSTLYRESTGVPLIVAGSGIAPASIKTNAMLVDIYPTVLQALGVSTTDEDAALPGRSLLESIVHPEPDRVAFSEYHAVGSASGAFMVADARYKYHHYVGYEPELFDLDEDPGETRDLAHSPAHRDVMAAMAAKLRAIVDPEAIDRLAKDDQHRLVEAHGGREKVLAMARGGATRVPGARG